MTIPVIAPPPSGVLSRAYLTTAMFKGYPHWLDLDDLIEGGVENVQDDALADVLLAASDWAVGECGDMLLHAHWVQNEHLRTRVGAGGRIYLHPRNIPVRAVTSLSYGWDPSAMTTLNLAGTTVWIEDGRQVSFLPYGGLNFTGPAIQFGPAPRPGSEVYVQWSYIPGFPFALLADAATEDAMAVTVDDPAGILPGDVLRCYDPGQSEAFTVASTYTPAMPTWPPTATSIPLAAAVQNPHAAGTGVTGFPRKALQSVIAYGVALLMRTDVSGEEPVSGFGPDARTAPSSSSGKAGGLVNNAREWLAPYAPVLRS